LGSPGRLLQLEYDDANISSRAHKRIEAEDSTEGVIKYIHGVVTGFYTVNYSSYDAPVEIEIDCENGLVMLVSDMATIRFNGGREISADAILECTGIKRFIFYMNLFLHLTPY